MGWTSWFDPPSAVLLASRTSLPGASVQILHAAKSDVGMKRALVAQVGDSRVILAQYQPT